MLDSSMDKKEKDRLRSATVRSEKKAASERKSSPVVPTAERSLPQTEREAHAVPLLRGDVVWRAVCPATRVPESGGQEQLGN